MLYCSVKCKQAVHSFYENPLGGSIVPHISSALLTKDNLFKKQKIYYYHLKMYNIVQSI